MVAVITGATGGLGREFARQLAEKGCDLVLTGRRAEELDALAQEIEARYGVGVQPVAADLSNPAGVEQLLAVLAGRPAGVLINNAGFGLLGDSASLSWERQEALLAVNIRALHRLTLAFAASMERGYILNVGSLAGEQPAPGAAAYAASKAYVNQWSRAVGYELRRAGRAVQVSVLCPGPVKTGFDRAAGAVRLRGGMTPERCARIALRGLFRGKAQIVPGLSMKLLRLAARLLPDRVMLSIQYRLQTRKRRP